MENKTIYLRPVEPEDASLLVIWENNPENWRVSGTEAPFSYHAIREYINSIQSFRESKELRLMICMKDSNRPIGTLDLFDANFKHGRAHIGILIADESERGNGFAKDGQDTRGCRTGKSATTAAFQIRRARLKNAGCGKHRKTSWRTDRLAFGASQT